MAEVKDGLEGHAPGADGMAEESRAGQSRGRAGAAAGTGAAVERSAAAAGGSPGGPPARRGVSHPLTELTLARLRESLREPEVIFWVFVFPILLTFALGIAFRNTGPEKVRVAVEGAARGGVSPSAGALAGVLSRSEGIEAVVLPPNEAASALRGGKVALVVRAAGETAAGAGEPAAAGDDDEATAGAGESSGGAGPRASLPRSFEYRYDPTRPESSTARLAVDDALQRALGRGDVARAAEQRVTEPGARYIDFLVPGLLGMNLMGSGMWGVGFAVVTARVRKLLKRLAATPMRRFHYLLAFVLSRMIFLVVEVGVVLLFARLAFDFTVRGSLVGVVLLLTLGALTFSGLGLLVAARPRTTEAVGGLMNLLMMPMWLLSGTFFSSERFPALLQPFIKALPLTALNDSLRAVMNEGAPVLSVWPALAVLAAWCVVSFALALKFFRWQ